MKQSRVRYIGTKPRKFRGIGYVKPGQEIDVDSALAESLTIDPKRAQFELCSEERTNHTEEKDNGSR